VTQTPLPTPTSAPSGVYVLPNHTAYVNSIDYLNIVGEVQNSTGNHLRFVRVTGNVFDAGGRLLDTGFTYIFADNLPAGERACFRLSMPAPNGWTHYEFEAPTYRTDGVPLPNLSILNDSGSYNPTFGWYEIIGQIRNDQATRVEYVSPIAAVYNASGNIVGCDFAFVSSTHLDPGQTSSFKITLSGRDYADVTSYRLQADGNLE
jgi:hypothetical protein